MNELVIIFGMGIVAGMALGILVMICYAAYRIKVIMNQLDQYVDEAIDTTLMGIHVEKHEGFYRFYRSKDNQFILQTETLDNIKELIGREYPTKTCYVESGEPDVVAELKQVLKK